MSEAKDSPRTVAQKLADYPERPGRKVHELCDSFAVVIAGPNAYNPMAICYEDDFDWLSKDEVIRLIGICQVALFTPELEADNARLRKQNEALVASVSALMSHSCITDIDDQDKFPEDLAAESQARRVIRALLESDQ